MKNLKVGDIVYSLSNSSWGLQPMVITREYVDSPNKSFQCNHPIWGDGAFEEKDLVKVTKAREKKIKKLNQYIAIVEKMEKKLFDKTEVFNAK